MAGSTEVTNLFRLDNADTVSTCPRAWLLHPGVIRRCAKLSFELCLEKNTSRGGVDSTPTEIVSPFSWQHGSQGSLFCVLIQRYSTCAPHKLKNLYLYQKAEMRQALHRAVPRGKKDSQVRDHSQLMSERTFLSGR